MIEPDNARFDWRVYTLAAIIGFILLGQQNRFYRANDNWIYTRGGEVVVLSAIVIALLVLWGLLSIRMSKRSGACEVRRDPCLLIDGFVVVVVLSCVANRITDTSLLYMIALLGGVVLCRWIVYLRLNPAQVRFLLLSIISYAAVIAVTNLARLSFGWTLPFTEPSEYFKYGSSERASLWFGNPNDLGCVMALAAILSMWFWESARDKAIKIIALCLLCVFFRALLDTYSRGAMVGLAVGATLYLTRPDWRRRALIPAACMLAVALCSFGNLNVYSTRLASSVNVKSESSISSRLIVWGESLKMIKNHPVLGVGPGNFAYEFASQYHGRRRLPGYSTAMNNVLTLGAESGVIAPALYLAIVVISVGVGLCNPKVMGVGYGDTGRILASILCAIVVCGLFTYDLCKVYYCISWMIAGLTLVCCNRTFDPESRLAQ